MLDLAILESADPILYSPNIYCSATVVFETLEGRDWNESAKSVHLLLGILIVIVLTGQSDADTEWNALDSLL